MTEELNKHIEAMRSWIEKRGNIPKQLPGLSVEERKQLQTVNKAIKQLNRLGVSVPDDLRRLKLQLSAKDVSGLANTEVEIRLAELEALIEQLRKLLKATRSIRDRLKTTGRTGGTKKHYGIKLLDLLQCGQLSTEDKLELQWLKEGSTYEGKVNPDGTVMAKTPDGWKQYDSLSTAGSQIAGRSLNGWSHWRRINSDGSRTPLKKIRSLYMNKEANQ